MLFNKHFFEYIFLRLRRAGHHSEAVSVLFPLAPAHRGSLAASQCAVAAGAEAREARDEGGSAGEGQQEGGGE